MQWASTGIYVWFWERSAIPSDILNGAPNVPSWPATPLATFSGSGCDYNTYFSDMQIIFNIDFCGSWAGDVWTEGACSAYADTCNDYVNQNPTAFSNANWLINSVKVYQ
jgi:hypothetical protein